MHSAPPVVGRDTPPLRAVALAPARVLCTREADGGYRLRSPEPLAPYDPSLARMFRAAATAAPKRTFLAERLPDGAWRSLTYAQARGVVDAIAQALLDRGLSPERPVMVLSGNAIDHGLLMLACYTAGVPIVPVSVAYSVQSRDFAKLKHIAALVAPGLVYVADTGAFAAALDALALPSAEIVATVNGAARAGVTPFAALCAATPGPAVEAAVAATGAGTIAKILFTSGSTGLPKGVINTHGMLAANQQQLAQVWPFLGEEPPVVVDWLPWNHTFGGNHNFNLVLRHAGTFHIDAGKPLPALIGETVRNLREIAPTVYFNVPAGFAALLPHLEQDAALARTFFSRLRLILYAGAALPDDLWQRLDRVALHTVGERIAMTSSWGTTETSPLATAAHFPLERAGVVGIPVPGVELRLVPNGAKLEVRVKGPNVTPGYFRRDDLTAAAFDAQGFYRPGDAVRFAAPDDPAQGLVFDGRLAEDFKLLTGTWVHVGALRIGVLAAASPVLQDVVVAGENRAFVALLAWLNPSACQGLIGAGAPAGPAELACHPRLRAHLQRTLAAWNRDKGSAERIARVLVLDDPPSIDANEITDKGYINQRLVLERRSAALARLFAESPDAEVIVLA